MGVFGEFFGFDGRINRLGYLWRSIVVAVALGALGVAGVVTIGAVLHPDGLTGAGPWPARMITGLTLLALWSNFALTSRRLRDMGVEPAYVMPAYAALWVVNTVLLEPMSRIDPARFGLMEAGWVGLQWLALVPLLFWPTRAAPLPVAGAFEPAGPTAYLDWRGQA
jgi:uncharacterized membrane protein YhaH (DUF805 family)